MRPDSFELDINGEISGKILETTYGGESVEAVLRVSLPQGESQDLIVHIHPEDEVMRGQTVRFKVLPHFVAVIRH
ncbi:MAG: hypothetical protein KGZ63_14485 [Clostridiales bacterium]|nr:hypothetical protein [Clostridiales bacterium]